MVWVWIFSGTTQYNFVLKMGGSRKYPYPYYGQHLGIPKGGGVTSTGIPRTWGGGHWTGIPKAYGGFQKSNFQFGVGKSLQEKLVKNDLSKDDDSLVNTTGGISEFRRGGGLCQLELQGHGGVTSTGIPRTWGGGHWTGIPKAYGGFSEE